MGLQHITNKKGHEAGENLILLTPGPYSWSVHSKHLERILSSHNQSDGKQFKIREEISEIFVDRFGRIIISLDSDVRVQLANRPGVLLEHLTVPSGNTVLELEDRSRVERVFILSLCVDVGSSVLLLSHAVAAHINILHSHHCEQQQGR